VAYGDGYRELHKQMETEGRIKHDFKNCPEQKGPGIFRVCDEDGNWSLVPVPLVPSN
jgi:hypothetical protein